MSARARLAAGVILMVGGWACAQGLEASGASTSIRQRETLTGNWLGLGEQLEKQGIRLGLGATQVYQLNLNGGLATHRHSGRYAGSYDLEVEADLERLLGLRGGSVYALVEGSWSEGLSAASLGNAFGVNDDAAGNRSIDVTELWYEQAFLDGRLRFRLGKVDLTGGFECRGCPVCFDGNAYANDETAQFLNAALVNNPTVPFPDNGLGVVVYLEPFEGGYVSAGAADARADASQTGFRTAFHDADDFFGIFETGVVLAIPSANGSLIGGYRAGFWYDPQPKARFNGRGDTRDDVGFYLSFDQTLLKENADADDTQGLGAFFRYGFAHSDVNEIRTFWSGGAQYQGLIPSRDDDVLGIGFATGRMVGAAGYGRSYETVLEVYYSMQITGWLRVAPSFQYVWHPGAVRGVGDAFVVGFRVQMAF